MAESNDLLYQVRQAIAHKQYETARDILTESQHPKRDEWLANIEQVQQNATTTQAAARTRQLLWLSVFILSGFFVGFLFEPYFNAQPERLFSNETLTLTLPEGWRDADYSQTWQCENVTCHVGINRTGSRLALLVTTYSIDATTLDQVLLTNRLRLPNGAQILEQGVYELRDYDARYLKTQDERFVTLDIFIMGQGQVHQIMAWVEGREMSIEQRESVEAIAQSLTITALEG